jgi:hypothetical protein
MSEQTVTAEQLANYLKRTGKAGARTLHILGKHQSFVEALNSTYGQEILHDALQRHEQLLDRIASLDATDGEKGEYKALKDIIIRWSEKIAAYEDNLKRVSNG